MTTNASTPEPSDDDILDEDIRAVFSDAVNPSSGSYGGPSPDVDSAILRMASERLSAIRKRNRGRRAFAGVTAVAASLATAFIFFVQRGPAVSKNQSVATPEDPYAVILREVTSLFPHQVRAIKTDGGELQIALSDEPIADDAQAVVIEACGNGGCSVVITYVGQTVELGHQRLTVEADKDGVIVIQKQQAPAHYLQIKSRSI